MKPPTLEVADIIRSAGDSFIGRNQCHLGWQQLKVLRAIKHCRTAALGGHLDQCSRCGHRAISFFSCRNRHCPKCQTNARNQWLAARSDELLGVSYFHVVFTLPHDLSALALQNKRAIYDLLFQTSAATLSEIAADPKHLGAEIGFLSVLHTWGQNLQAHPHCTLRHPHRWSVARPLALDSSEAPLLPTGESAQPCFSRQVRLRAEAPFPQKETQLPWKSPTSERSQALSPLFETVVPAGLGGLRQATIRRTGIRPPIPGPLHPSRGHFQPPTHLLGRWRGHLPMEGLCSRQQEAQNGRHDRRIPASVSAARPNARLCAHPPLWFPFRAAAPKVHSGLPAAAGARVTPAALSYANGNAADRHLAVPMLWRRHENHGEAHGSADPLAIR